MTRCWWRTRPPQRTETRYGIWRGCQAAVSLEWREKTKHTFSWLIVTVLSPIMWKMKQIDTTLFPQYNKVLHGNKILFHCWTMWQDALSCVKCAAENPLKIATGWYWYTWRFMYLRSRIWWNTGWLLHKSLHSRVTHRTKTGQSTCSLRIQHSYSPWKKMTPQQQEGEKKKERKKKKGGAE